MSPNKAAKAEQQKSSKAQTFLKRSLSTLLLWALVFVTMWFNHPALFLAFFLLLTIVGLWEYFRLFPEPSYRRYRWQSFAATLCYGALIYASIGPWRAGLLSEADCLAIALLFVLIAAERILFPLNGFRTIDEIATTVFGFVYIVILFGFVAKIMDLPPPDGSAGQGRFYIVFLLVVTKFTDTGAYLVGSLFGKHKMIPRISPGKTWEGFVGALLFAQLGSWGCVYFFGGHIPLITGLHVSVLGLILALAAVLGDLSESILKRSFEAKDSGHEIPGIGGVLDLIDSILLTGPVLYAYLLVLSAK